MYMLGRLRTASSPSRTVIAEAPYSSCAFFFWAATVGMLSSGFHAGGPVTAAVAYRPLYRDRGPGPIFWERFYLSGRAVCPISLLTARPDVRHGGPYRSRGSEGAILNALLTACRRQRRTSQLCQPYVSRGPRPEMCRGPFRQEG